MHKTKFLGARMENEKALNQYERGLISVDKAAKLVGITVSEMMKAIALHGIKSEETLEEYRRGVKLLTT